MYVWFLAKCDFVFRKNKNKCYDFNFKIMFELNVVCEIINGRIVKKIEND